MAGAAAQLRTGLSSLWLPSSEDGFEVERGTLSPGPMNRPSNTLGSSSPISQARVHVPPSAILAEYSFLEGDEPANTLPPTSASSSSFTSSLFPHSTRAPDSFQRSSGLLQHSVNSLGCCRIRSLASSSADSSSVHRSSIFVARASVLFALVSIATCTVLLLTTTSTIDLGSFTTFSIEVMASLGADPHSLSHPFSAHLPEFNRPLGERADASLFGLRGGAPSGGPTGFFPPSVPDEDRRLIDAEKTAVAPDGVKRKYAVWLSDIHLDPFYGAPTAGTASTAVCASHSKIVTSAQTDAAPYGILGCDPPPRLWSSAVEAAKVIAKEVNTDTLLFTGDFTRHKQHFFIDPFMNVSDLIGAASDKLVDEFGYITKQSRILGTLGNDDSPRNYEVNITDSPMNPWYHRLSSKFAEANAMSEDRAEAYDFGGYYETKVHNVLVLNIQTIIYSAFHYPKTPMVADPFGQLRWLRDRLTYAMQKGMKAWIVGHIPPGIETFGYTRLWHHAYLDDYRAIVEDPVLGKVVAAQFFGHTHTDEFRVLPDAPQGSGPVLVSGAISPIYDNNPTFRLIEYDAETGKLQNIKVYWANLTDASPSKPLEWRFGYDFIGTYPDLAAQAAEDGGLSNAGFARLAKALEASANVEGGEWSRYVAWYKALVPNDLTNLLRPDADSKLPENNRKKALREYFCALNVTSAKQFEKCVDYSVPTRPAPPDFETMPDAMEYYSKARMHHRIRVGV